MYDVVWSINIMCAILIIGVAYVIYWIFMYDSWYPNDVHSDSSGSPHGPFVSDIGVDSES